MSRMQREKGKRFEREIARRLRDLGYETHRGQQADGAREADVVVESGPLAGVWLELKCGARPNVWAAMEQAIRDAGGKVPVVVAHRDRGETLVCLRLEDALRLLGEADH